jgi:hypothetical protein
MNVYSNITVRRTSLISVVDLRALFQEITDKRPDICIRYRLIGEMWANYFMRVVSVRGNAVLLQNERDGKLVSIHDMANIMQIELDHSFSGYQPFFHYEIQPFPA